jgi:dipeptidyl aminopeptidase/acylaminoacyl peptidase
VTRFVFAPDGSEVWCVQEDGGGSRQPAAVLYPKEKHWEEIPAPRTGRTFHDVVFSKDGETTWLAIRPDDQGNRGLLERTRYDRRWVPIRAKMPEHYSSITKLWLSPKGDELWLNNDGSGVLRVKLATGGVSQYVKSDFRRDRVEKHYLLVEDYAQDLAFTSDGKYVVCSARGGGNYGISLIDLRTGQSHSFLTEHEVRAMTVSPDGRTVLCEMTGARAPALLDTRASDVAEPSAEGAYDALEELAEKRGLWVLEAAGPPKGPALVCLLSNGDDVGIYLFTPAAKSLKLLKSVGTAKVTAMDLGPQGLVWAALPGSIISVDPATGALTEFD